MIKIKQGDCLELMKEIPDKSIDMILCDLPYGTTACKWDTIIPFEPLWEQYKRIIKDNGAIVLFGSQPFTSKMINSNMKMFKEELIWEKHRPSNFANAKYRHLKYHENIIVFSKGKYTYNRQMQKRYSERFKQAIKNGNMCHRSVRTDGNEVSMQTKYKPYSYEKYNPDLKNPTSIIKFPSVVNNSKEKVNHPTQKPVALLEYLIKTYTNEWETVLDNCMGSGSTGVACINTNRNFIGFELDENYFNIAKERLGGNI